MVKRSALVLILLSISVNARDNIVHEA